MGESERAKLLSRTQISTKHLMFYGRKIISSKTGLHQKKLIKNFWSKIFNNCKTTSSKTCLHQKKLIKIFLSKLFHNCKTISSKTCLHQCFSSYNFCLRHKRVKSRSAREKGRERFCESETRRLEERVRQGKRGKKGRGRDMEREHE